MIYIAIILAIVFSAWPFFVDYKDKSPFVLLWPLNFIFVLLPVVTNYFIGTYSTEVILEALFFYIVCNFLYCMTVIFLKGLSTGFQFSTSVQNFDISPSRKKDSIVYACAALMILIFIVNGISIDRILSSTLSDKRDLSIWYLLILYLAAYLFPYTLYAYFNKKRLMFFGLMCLYCLILLYFRSRSILAFVFLSFLYYILFWVRRGYVYILTLGVTVLILSQVLKVIRYQGALREGLSIERISDGITAVIMGNLDSGSGDLSIANVFLDIVRDHQTAFWSGGWLLIVKFFGRFLGYDGSRTIEYVLWDNYYAAGINGSLHPTGYGYFFADAGGFVGAIFFILLAFLRLFVQRLMIGVNPVAYLGFVMYFVLFFSRGSVYNGTMILLVGVTLGFLLNKAVFRRAEAHYGN